MRILMMAFLVDEETDTEEIDSCKKSAALTGMFMDLGVELNEQNVTNVKQSSEVYFNQYYEHLLGNTTIPQSSHSEEFIPPGTTIH